MASTDPTDAKSATPAEDPNPDGVLLESTDTLEDLKAAVAQATAAFRTLAGAVQAPVDLSAYRTVRAARGLEECQRLLDQGWDVLHFDFCEEIRRRSGPAHQPTVMAWTPYFIMGRRDTLVPADRRAILVAEEQAAMASGLPMPDDGQPQQVDAPQEPPPAAATAAAPAGGEPVGRGRRVTAASPRTKGFEGIGGLRGR